MFPASQQPVVTSLEGASRAHIQLAGTPVSFQPLFDADQLMLWILFVTAPHLVGTPRRRGLADSLCDPFVPAAVAYLGWDVPRTKVPRAKFIEFLYFTAVADLPRAAAHWTRTQLAGSNLHEQFLAAVEMYAPSYVVVQSHAVSSMAARYALVLHPDAGVVILPTPEHFHPLAIYTREARRQYEVISFVSGQVSADAEGCRPAQPYDPARPRYEQPLSLLVGPVRFSWPACTPNCQVRPPSCSPFILTRSTQILFDAPDDATHPWAARLIVLHDLPAGSQLVVDQLPHHLGELRYLVECIHEREDESEDDEE